MNPLQNYSLRPDNALENKAAKPSALESAANVLSLPGSSVRDVLALRNPLDQWLTPFSDENRTSGRELLRQHSLATANDTFANFAAGMATEFLTDPLTFLPGIGVLTKAGKIASKAGLVQKANLAEDVTKTARQIIDSADDTPQAIRRWRLAGGTDDLLDKPIRAVIKVTPPKTNGLEFSGEKARPIAAAIDSLSAMAFDVPGARQLRAIFSPTVLNARGHRAQEIAVQRTKEISRQIDSLSDNWVQNDPAKSASIINNARKLAEDAGIDQVDDTMSLQQAKHLTRAAGIAHAAVELLGITAKADGDGIPIAAALERLGLNRDRSLKNLRKYVGDTEALIIPNAVVEDAERMIRPFTINETKSVVRNIVEKFTNILKTNVTITHPAFHTRNLISGQIQNIVKGLADETQNGPMRYVRPFIDAIHVTSGKPIKGVSSLPEWKGLGLSDAEVTNLLKSEAYSHGLLDTSLLSDLHVSAPSTSPTWMQALNPLQVAGGLSKDNKFLPARIGEKIARQTELLNRLSPFIALRKSGVAPAEAARRVKIAQVDYTNATDWEKRYGTIIIPFYQFSKGMMESLIEDIATAPGGRTAMAIKATGRASQDNQTPSFLDGQTTIPTGDGTLAFGGLMTDSALNPLMLAAQAKLPELAAEIGSRLNPLLKFPIESATGQSLFHRRPLYTVSPTLGALIQNASKLTGSEHQPPNPILSRSIERLIELSPMARYLSTARKLTEPNRAFPQKLTELLGVSKIES